MLYSAHSLVVFLQIKMDLMDLPTITEPCLKKKKRKILILMLLQVAVMKSAKKTRKNTLNLQVLTCFTVFCIGNEDWGPSIF